MIQMRTTEVLIAVGMLGRQSGAVLVPSALAAFVGSCAAQETAPAGAVTSDASAMNRSFDGSAERSVGPSPNADAGLDASSSPVEAAAGGVLETGSDSPFPPDGGLPSSDGGLDAKLTGEAGAAAWTCPAGLFGSPMLSAVPTRVAAVPPSDAFNNNNTNYGIIEGPAWLGDALYVSEIASGPNPPLSRILKVTTDGTVTVAIADSGSNGLAIDKKGNLYGAIHKDGSVSRLDLSTSAATPIVATYMGNRFNSPNDLALRRDGNIYFSDPNYQAPTPNPQSQTRVYRVAPGASAATSFDATLTQPNGVTLSLDETALYVASVGGIFKYALMTDGSVGARTAFAPALSGDGMVIDCADNLYVTQTGGGNVVVLGPTGVRLGQISVPAGMVQAVTNVAFGGVDHKTLYITALGSAAQKALFKVALSIPGMPY